MSGEWGYIAVKDVLRASTKPLNSKYTQYHDSVCYSGPMFPTPLASKTSSPPNSSPNSNRQRWPGPHPERRSPGHFAWLIYIKTTSGSLPKRQTSTAFVGPTALRPPYCLGFHCEVLSRKKYNQGYRHSVTYQAHYLPNPHFPRLRRIFLSTPPEKIPFTEDLPP